MCIRDRPGRMAQARSGTTIGLRLQLTHILRAEEAGPRTLDHTGFPAAKSALPHRQILHEGNQRMHWGHRTGQLVHIHHPGSHLRVLANEAGSGIATVNGFHDPKPGSIPLDHLTHGVTRVPGKLPKTDGTSPTTVSYTHLTLPTNREV